MKFFKVLSVVLLVCIVLFFVIGLFLPKTGTYENTYKIDAPANVVEAEILELYANHLWPIWSTEDTSVTFINEAGELGYTWEGDLVGKGACKVSLGNDLSIRDYISFQNRDMAETVWQLTPGNETTINFTFKVFAGSNIGARWTNVFMNRIMGDEINTVISEMKLSLENRDL